MQYCFIPIPQDTRITPKWRVNHCFGTRMSEKNSHAKHKKYVLKKE